MLLEPSHLSKSTSLHCQPSASSSIQIAGLPCPLQSWPAAASLWQRRRGGGGARRRPPRRPRPAVACSHGWAWLSPLLWRLGTTKRLCGKWLLRGKWLRKARVQQVKQRQRRGRPRRQQNLGASQPEGRSLGALLQIDRQHHIKSFAHRPSCRLAALHADRFIPRDTHFSIACMRACCATRATFSKQSRAKGAGAWQRLMASQGEFGRLGLAGIQPSGRGAVMCPWRRRCTQPAT